MQIDSDAEDETQMRTESEKDRAKDNNQVNTFRILLCINNFILMVSSSIFQGARYGRRFQ
jgi:hypothetical protein